MSVQRRQRMLDGMSGTSGTRGPRQSGFGAMEDTIKDFWASRPRRARGGRKIAGVAAGVGQRYGIDPVIVRVALVAATIFGGTGIVLYLLGWLLLPKDGDEVSALEGLLGRGHSSTSKGLALLLAVVLIPTLSWVFGGGWFDSGGLVALALLLVGLYLLHRSRGEYNRPATPASVPPAGFAGPDYNHAGDAGVAASTTTEHAEATDPSTPPAWDPLGAAPFAWDLPEPPPAPTGATPAAAPPRTPRHRSKIGIATFGAALLVAGVGAALNAAGTDWFSVRHIVGLALGVVGLGMVAGSFVRGGRGLIGLAIPLAIAATALTILPAEGLRGGVGTHTAVPTSAEQLRGSYEHGVGDFTLDLRRLPATVPVDTRVNNGVGTTRVVVPQTADVDYTCANRVGDMRCFGRAESGLGQQLSGHDVGVDGPGGPKITLCVTTTTGEVMVNRGG